MKNRPRAWPLGPQLGLIIEAALINVGIQEMQRIAKVRVLIYLLSSHIAQPATKTPPRNIAKQ